MQESALPYKFDSHRKQLYLDGLARGLRRGEAAKAAGVSRATVCLHIKNDPEFAAEVLDAEIASCDAVEAALYDKAISGNVTAILVYLFNRSGIDATTGEKRWSDRRYVREANQPQTMTIEQVKEALKQRGVSPE